MKSRTRGRRTLSTELNSFIPGLDLNGGDLIQTPDPTWHMRQSPDRLNTIFPLTDATS